MTTDPYRLDLEARTNSVGLAINYYHRLARMALDNRDDTDLAVEVKPQIPELLQAAERIYKYISEGEQPPGYYDITREANPEQPKFSLSGFPDPYMSEPPPKPPQPSKPKPYTVDPDAPDSIQFDYDRVTFTATKLGGQAYALVLDGANIATLTLERTTNAKGNRCSRWFNRQRRPPIEGCDTRQAFRTRSAAAVAAIDDHSEQAPANPTPPNP